MTNGRTWAGTPASSLAKFFRAAPNPLPSACRSSRAGRKISLVACVAHPGNRQLGLVDFRRQTEARAGQTPGPRHRAATFPCPTANQPHRQGCPGTDKTNPSNAGYHKCARGCVRPTPNGDIRVHQFSAPTTWHFGNADCPQSPRHFFRLPGRRQRITNPRRLGRLSEQGWPVQRRRIEYADTKCAHLGFPAAHNLHPGEQ